MRLSVITINYNNLVGLESTVKSVLNQTFKDFEYIVIDGNSSDGSADYLSKEKGNFSYWVSEPDTGIYNAMNKGLKRANGEYLLFLNSGDTLVHEDVLKHVIQSINSNIDIYYGNLNFVYDGVKRLKTYPDKLSFSFFYKESLPHPATFIKKDLFERVFLFNENFKIVSDWEFLICAICKLNVTYKHIDIVISDFDACGVSNDANNRPLILKERNEVLHKHFPLFLDDSESLYKMNEYFHLNRFKMLVELEKSFIARKLNSLLMRIQLFLFRNKQIKNL